ncbi:hypothetical protein BJX66DRAFT_229566 [Aspergillus keveii]|uniref:Uncharacterized protein n=1 Tax=Aspergillus keveii TaxID=714993 RepID=A0ABR4GL81_9EURO
MATFSPQCDTVMIIPRLTLGSMEHSFTSEVFARFLTQRQVSVMVDTNMLVLELKDLIVEKVNSTRDDPNKLESVNMRLIQKTDNGFRELLNGQSASFLGLVLLWATIFCLKVGGYASVGYSRWAELFRLYRLLCNRWG